MVKELGKDSEQREVQLLDGPYGPYLTNGELNASLPKNVKPDISRFKGLGEMPPEDLKKTTLDPHHRRALRVVIDGELETDQLMSDLMGRDAAPRYQFIMEHAPHAQADDLDV